MERSPARRAEVGGLEVRRALPQRHRRTIGAWCFVDHFGPTGPTDDFRMTVGPHPHIGLSTVTWLLDGEALHTDSLGTEQLIRPGQLNLMTAGEGIAHAEETPVGRTGRMHGVQFWVAQPDATRHGAAAFEHHGELPQVAEGPMVASVLVGSLLGERSPARCDTPLVGAELSLGTGSVEIGLDPTFEHAVVPIDGSVRVSAAADDDPPGGPGAGSGLGGAGQVAGADGAGDGPGGAGRVAGRRGVEGSSEVVAADTLVHLGPGRSSLRLEAVAPVRLLLVGGEPFEAEVLMWWNFVARTRDEVDTAIRDWADGSDRFGEVRSGLGRIPAPDAPWARPTASDPTT